MVTLLPTAVVGFSSLPVGVLVVFGVVLLIEIALDVIALVDLYRRPIDALTLGNKWVWVAIIVLVNLVGAILYFAVGRKAVAPSDERAAAGTGPAHPKRDIGDALYGPRDDSKQP